MTEQSDPSILPEAPHNDAPAEPRAWPHDGIDRIAVVELSSGHCLIGPQAELQAMIDRGEARLASAYDLDISQNLVRYV